MYVYYPVPLIAEVWDQISKMVFENYSIGYENDCVLLCPHRTAVNVPYYRSTHPNSKIIAYQLEYLGAILSPQGEIYSTNLIDCLSKFDEIWDYDIHNIEILNKYGINAKFKPFQYTEALKTVKNVETPDIDVLFLGTPSKSRGEFFHSLIEGCYIPEGEFEEQISFRFISACQVYGKFKDEFTARAKIILSVPQWSNAPYQGQARIYHDLINNKCVLSQKGPHNYYDDLIIEYDDHNDCAAKIRYLLRDDNWKKYTDYSFKDYCDRKYKGL